MRGDEEDGAGKRDSHSCCEVFAAAAKNPGGCRADGEGEKGKARRETERGEGLAGNVEQVGHRQRIVAHAAMGEQVADVGNEGRVVRSTGRRPMRRRR